MRRYKMNEKQEINITYLLENNIDVLITDHHTPNGHTPANVWIIDAFHNNDDENNKGLCGAGVAFKLVQALSGIEEAKKYITEAIRAGADISVGNGFGPVNHSFNPLKMIINEIG